MLLCSTLCKSFWNSGWNRLLYKRVYITQTYPQTEHVNRKINKEQRENIVKQLLKISGDSDGFTGEFHENLKG